MKSVVPLPESLKTLCRGGYTPTVFP